MNGGVTVFLRAVFAASLCAVVCSCATHLDDTREVRALWDSGNYPAAAAKMKEKSDEAAETADALVWKLEEGSSLRAVGNFEASFKSFDEAFALVEAFDKESEVDLGAETKAIFTNLSYLPYKGYNYDRIMLGVYQALNDMRLGKLDDAAVMLKRVENFQKNAERENAEAVARSVSQARSYSGRKTDSGDTAYNYNKAMSNSKFRNALSAQYGSVALKTSVAMSERGLYVNPFAYWLDGVYFTVCGKDFADFSRAADSLRLSREMVSSKYLDSDWEIAKQAARGASVADRTYVIYEAGSAPVRNQIRIDIPLFIATRDVPYVGASFPKLQYNSNWSAAMPIVADGVLHQPEPVVDMDAVVKREFDDLLPMVIAKTLLSAGTKGTAQYGLQEAARQSGNDYVLLMTILVGSIYQASMNDADLRCWGTLPKQILIASFPTPKNRKLTVGGREITLDDARANFVCVRKVGANSTVSVSPFSIGRRDSAAQGNPLLK